MRGRSQVELLGILKTCFCEFARRISPDEHGGGCIPAPSAAPLSPAEWTSSITDAERRTALGPPPRSGLTKLTKATMMREVDDDGIKPSCKQSAKHVDSESSIKPGLCPLLQKLSLLSPPPQAAEIQQSLPLLPPNPLSLNTSFFYTPRQL